MSWAVRELNEEGRLEVVDVIWGTKPAGENVVRAEYLFRKAAGALFVKRAILSELLDVDQADHVAVAVRTMATVAGAKDKENGKEFRALIFSIAKTITAPINTRWSYDLNGYHHPLAERMMNYYKKAVTDTKNPPVQ